MKHLVLIAFALSAALLASAQPAAAQEARATPAPKNLAFEIEGDPAADYQIQIKGVLETNPRRWLPGWQQPAGAAPLTTVRIESDYEGDAVRFNVSVVFDDSHAADAPGPKYGRKEQAVASYSAREGESVRLEGLARFGVEPMTLRVVKAKPRPEEPALASTPLVTNSLKAVQVVGFEPDQSAASRNTYKLRLQNVSQKGIATLALHDKDSSGQTTLIAQGGAARPLIAPGDVRETQFRFHVNQSRTPQGYVNDADRQRTLTVGTIVFDDGTHEGDDLTAATILAGQRGGEIQRARVLPLLRALLDTPPPDPAAALDRLKSDVSALRIDADPAAVAELAAQFPSLAGGEQGKPAGHDAVRSVSLYMMTGLKNGREIVLQTIKQWEEMRARAPETFDLRRQLTAFVEQLEKGGRL